jgi:hypothetical protein
MSARFRLAVPFAAAAILAVPPVARGQLQPGWVSRHPVGSSLSAGLYGMVVDPAGVTYVTGTSGSSSNTDVTTAAWAADGGLLWARTWDGPGGGHDQARGLALGPDGHLYVTGNTPGPGSYANVLVLEYDAATGDLLDSVQLPAGPFASEHGASIAADAAGNVYVAGGTTGDGADVLVFSLDAAGALRWRQTWDGPAAAPYSQDTALELALDPAGDLLVLIHGVMGTLQPDFVVRKHAPADGALIWHATWGVGGGDYPSDLELDAAGDVYVTGSSVGEYSTVRLRGGDGGLVWQRYDAAGVRNSALAVALDGRGGVYVTGVVDPDGDQSNSNDDVYTVKRDAASGDLRWSHYYGEPCLFCFDAPADVASDRDGYVFVAAGTSSPPYAGDEILLLLDGDTGTETDRGVVAGVAPGEVVAPGILLFDAAWNLYDGGVMTNYDTGAVEMSVTLWPALAAPALFADGFEDGTTAAWTATVP